MDLSPRFAKPEELLAQMDWVRTLASSLVSDPAIADDIAQDAWLAAQHAPAVAGEGALRAWLAAVVRNLVRKSVRSGRRRRWREEAASRAEEVESTSDVVERASLHAELSNAVMSLEEPYRSTVLLRYLDGLSTTEVARRLGISPAAARKRLSRANEALREILDGLHGGDRRAWSMALISFVRNTAPPKAAATATQLVLIGGLTMKTFLTLTLIPIAVLLALGAWFFGSGSPTGEDLPIVIGGEDLVAVSETEAAPVERASRREGVTLESAPAESEAPDAVARPAAGELPLLVGVVVDGEGRPVEGAEVLLWASAADVDQEPLQVLPAGPGGVFEIPVATPQFVVAARAEGMVSSKGLRGSLEQGVSSPGLELVLAPALDLSGAVVDEDGAPIEGARLRLGNSLNQTSSTDLTSTPGVRTFGELPGAQAADQVTGADGTFFFPALVPGWIGMRVEAAGFVGDWVSLAVDGQPARVVLRRGDRIRGTVFDESGRPLEGARVRYGPYASNLGAGNKSETRTDSRGGFEFQAVDMEDHEVPYVAVIAEGYAVELVQPVEVDTGAGGSTDISLIREAPLYGRVVDPNGEPIPGVQLQLHGEGRYEGGVVLGHIYSWNSIFRTNRLESLEDGTFAFPNHRGDAGVIRVRVPGSRIYYNEPFSAGQSEVEIELDIDGPHGVVVTGTVISARTGEPLAGLEALSWRGDMCIVDSVKTREGRFEVEGIEPGSIRFELRSDGYLSHFLQEREFAVGSHELGEIRLDPACSFAVLAVDGTGAPLESVRLSFHVNDGEALAITYSGGFSGGSVLAMGEPLAVSGLPCQPLEVLAVRGDQKARSFIDPREYRDQPLVIPFEFAESLEPGSYQPVLTLLDRTQLESPELFAAELAEAMRNRDRDWGIKNMERLQAAGYKGGVAAVVNHQGRKIATGELAFNEESGDFAVSSNRMFLDGSQESTHFNSPIPAINLPDDLPHELLELQLFDTETGEELDSFEVEGREGAEILVRLLG